MRIIVNQEEFYVFKDKVFKRPIYYYNNKNTTLADKYFTLSDFRVSERKKELLNLLSTSPNTPEIKKEPQETTASLETQLADLLSYLKTDFNIKMDHRNRFYTIIEKDRDMFKSTAKKTTLFFSWNEIIQIYNTPYYFFNNVFQENKYIISKYKNLTSLNKKYVYVNIKKTKREGFKLESEKVVSIPL